MHINRNYHAVLLAISCISIIGGTYFRAINLGKFPFSIDEYYFYSAIKLTLANGLPEFLCGGFYTRGILLQYLSAPFVYLTQNQELAARIPSVLFSLLSFPAIYLIGKDSHSRLAGVLALFLFAFSIWQIEFARFARMYAPFQMILLWQVWLLLKPDFPNRSRNILLSGTLAVIATLFYAGGIFCVALAFLNTMLYQKSFKITEYIPAFIASAVAVILTIIPFRHLGAEYPFPTANILKPIASTNKFPVDLPTYLTFSNHSVFMLSLLVIYSFIAAFFLHKSFKNYNISLVTKVLLVIFTLALIANQFLFAMSLVIITLLISEKQQDLYKMALASSGIIFLVSTIFWIIACIVYFLATNETQGISRITKAIFNNFFSYPDIFYDVFRQWQKPMPTHSILAVVSVLIAIIICIFPNTKCKLKTRYFLATLITLTLLVSLINTPYNTSRYTFFLSPLVMVAIASCISWGSSLFSSKIAGYSIILACMISVCFASEDYRLKHLLGVDSYSSNHRQPYNKEYNEHLYPRYDYLAIANYLNINANAEDLVIITTPVIEHYLKPNQNAEYFITPENPEFVNHSACHGKQETWSDLPLIHKHKSLRNKLNKEGASKWVILHGERGNPFLTKKLGALKNDLEPYLVYKNPDRTLNLYKTESIK